MASRHIAIWQRNGYAEFMAHDGPPQITGIPTLSELGNGAKQLSYTTMHIGPDRRVISEVDLEVVITYEVTGGLIKITNVSVSSEDITSTQFGRLRIGEARGLIAIHEASTELTSYAKTLATGRRATDEEIETLQALVKDAKREAERLHLQTPKLGRAATSDAFYAEIAERYLRIVAVGSRSPIQDLKAELEAEGRYHPAATVRMWVALCREKGWLTRPLVKGQPGGEVGPKLIEQRAKEKKE